MNKGIDYGLGRTNVDPETGIRYGVISQHSVSPWALDDMEPDYGEPLDIECPLCGTMFGDEDIEWGDTPFCPGCGLEFEAELPDCAEPVGQYVDDGKYKVMDCLDSDLMVIKSPYFTYCQFCSPCVPGAGNLDVPIADGVKTYCLGHDWFDEDNPCPYPIYSVKTGEIVDGTEL